jgi:hypothetical protein
MNGYYANDSRSALSATQWPVVAGYGNAKATDDTSSCNNKSYNNGTTTPLTPCAFACHATTSTATDGYYQDLYGMARRLNPHQTPSASGGVTLRIDAVFAATENIINDMINSEQTAGQFSVGVYQFNDDVSSIVAGGGTDAEPEATSNLPTALSTVKSVDWMQTPSETAIPTLAEVGGQESNDFTNFGLAMNHLYSGTLASGTQQAIQPAGSGYTATAPQKDLFIVTDGLDDTTPLGNAAVNRLMGEMTSVTDENNTGYAGSNTVSTPLCRKFKNLGFTVYVLYINYNPIPSMTYYYTYYANASTPFVATDYPLLAHAYASYTGGNIQNWVEGDNTNNTLQTVDPEPTTPAPDIAALTACASTPQDFYTATNTASINTAMAAILKSALTSTTRLTQ